jgi:hypothetical protein
LVSFIGGEKFVVLLHKEPNYKYNSPIGLKAVYNEIVSSARYPNSKYARSEWHPKKKGEFLRSIGVSILPLQFGGHVISDVLLERRVVVTTAAVKAVEVNES